MVSFTICFYFLLGNRSVNAKKSENGKENANGNVSESGKEKGKERGNVKEKERGKESEKEGTKQPLFNKLCSCWFEMCDTHVNGYTVY